MLYLRRIGRKYDVKELSIMLKFGKKGNYRPALVSLAIGTIVGLIFKINFSPLLGISIGIILFLTMFIGHYLFVLPTIFNYWYSEDQFIRYNDVKSFGKRLLFLLMPLQLHLKTIAKKDIRTIEIIGLPQPELSLATRSVLSEESGPMSDLYLMVKEPVKIKLTLFDRSVIYLDLSRDYIKKPYETLGKLQIFLKEFNPRILDLSPEAKKLIKL